MRLSNAPCKIVILRFIVPRQRTDRFHLLSTSERCHCAAVFSVCRESAISASFSPKVVLGWGVSCFSAPPTLVSPWPFGTLPRSECFSRNAVGKSRFSYFSGTNKAALRQQRRRTGFPADSEGWPYRFRPFLRAQAVHYRMMRTISAMQPVIFEPLCRQHRLHGKR